MAKEIYFYLIKFSDLRSYVQKRKDRIEYEASHIRRYYYLVS